MVTRITVLFGCLVFLMPVVWAIPCLKCGDFSTWCACVDTGSCGHDFVVSIVTGDFLHGVSSFHLWYLLVSNPKNRTVVVVPSFLILLARSHVELVVVARPLPADTFTLLDLDASKIPSVRISCSCVGANEL